MIKPVVFSTKAQMFSAVSEIIKAIDYDTWKEINAHEIEDLISILYKHGDF